MLAEGCITPSPYGKHRSSGFSFCTACSIGTSPGSSSAGEAVLPLKSENPGDEPSDNRDSEILNHDFGSPSFLQQLVCQEDLIASSSATRRGGSVEEFPKKRRLWYKQTDPTRAELHMPTMMVTASTSNVDYGWQVRRHARLLFGRQYCKHRPMTQTYRSAHVESGVVFRKMTEEQQSPWILKSQQMIHMEEQKDPDHDGPVSSLPSKKDEQSAQYGPG